MFDVGTRQKMMTDMDSQQGRSQKFVSEGDKTGGLGTEQKFPSEVQGQSPGVGLVAKPPEAEAEDMC